MIAGNPGPLKRNEIGVIGFCSSFRGQREALEPGICFSLRSGFRVIADGAGDAGNDDNVGWLY